MSAHETITGEVESIRVVGDDFFAIAQVRHASGVATVVGKLLGAQDRDAVEVRGCWSQHPKWGRQFKAREVMVTVPRSEAGAVAWIASRLPQVGHERAVELVQRFGAARLWEVLEERPDELLEVPGITAKRRDAIVEAYRRHKHERDRMIRLKGWGLTDHQIGLATSAFGERVEEVLRDNPYALADQVHGFGFKRADRIARRMGLGLDAPPRIRAGLVHVLEEAAGHGHAYVPRGKLIALAAKLLEVSEQDVRPHVRAVVEAGHAVEHRGRLYRPSLHHAERSVAEGVRALRGRAS